MKPVERLWPGETVAILASGPSLTQEDADYVRGKARVIAINTSYQMAPWADVLYAADEKWWRWNKGVPEFHGMKYGLTKGSERYGVTVLRRGVDTGLSLNPAVLSAGKNGGYQAINLAVLLGASRILLLGYDMQMGPNGKGHWHPDHPNKSRANYQAFLSFFSTLVQPLKDAGVSIVNCTTRTALHAFPKMALREALPVAAEVSA